MLQGLKTNEDEYYFELLNDTFPDDPAKGAVIVTDGVHKISLPKSMIKINRMKGRDVSIVIPDWLAEDRNII